MDREFYEILSCSPQACKHVVESNQFGSYLTALAAGLEAAPQRGEFVESKLEINCLLVTENHAMALHMEKKAKDGVAYFVTKLYEPNETLNYKRVEQLTPAGFSALKLSDMLISPDYRPPALVAVCLDDSVHLEIDRGTISPTPENMLVALSNGAADAVRAMVDTQRRMPNWSRDALAELFWHRSSSGRTGLNLAFCHGHTETVSIVTQTLLGSGLPHDQMVNLLACHCPLGHPAFSVAFDMGHAETIEVFTSIVLASEKLDDDAKLWLLQARTPEGWSGLQLAMHWGQEDAAHAFLNAVEAAPNLSPAMRTRLLD